MDVQVLQIERIAECQWSVKLLIGQQEVSYPFTQEELTIGDRSIVGIVSDPAFRRFFKFNQHIIHQVTQLLIHRVNGEVIKFPVEVGRFLSSEQASKTMLITE